MSVNVQYINQKISKYSRAYEDTKKQQHIVSAELVEYRDARVAVILQDGIPIWGYNLKAKNTDDGFKEVLQYLWQSYVVMQKNPDLLNRIDEVGYDAFKEIKGIQVNW